jgi:hypothetical protein
MAVQIDGPDLSPADLRELTPRIRYGHTRALHPSRTSGHRRSEGHRAVTNIELDRGFPNYLFGPMSAGAFLFGRHRSHSPAQQAQWQS